MQGTFLNSKSQISFTNAKALKEALSRGVKVVIATGKVRADENIFAYFLQGPLRDHFRSTCLCYGNLFGMFFLKQTRPAVLNVLKRVDLAGRDGIISEFSPGVFLQVFLSDFVDFFSMLLLFKRALDIFHILEVVICKYWKNRLLGPRLLIRGLFLVLYMCFAI